MHRPTSFSHVCGTTKAQTWLEAENSVVEERGNLARSRQLRCRRNVRRLEPKSPWMIENVDDDRGGNHAYHGDDDGDDDGDDGNDGDYEDDDADHEDDYDDGDGDIEDDVGDGDNGD